MNIRFYIDPETGLPHIFNHGVTEVEARQVLARPGLVLKEAFNRDSHSVKPWRAAI
jgi:hypothetical protein